MQRFHVIDDAAVILRSKGVYRQQKVFQRDGGLYAGHGGGFIRLHRDSGASIPAISWDELDVGGAYAPDTLGRLILTQKTSRRK